MRNPKSGLCPLDHADAARVLIFTPAMARKRLPEAGCDEEDEEWWRSYNSFKEWYKANREEED